MPEKERNSGEKTIIHQSWKEGGSVRMATKKQNHAEIPSCTNGRKGKPREKFWM